MKLKHLALVAAAALGMAGVDEASACSIAAWTNSGAGGGAQGTPVPGRPTDTAPAVARYSGQCGLKSTASGSFVRDVTPNAEVSFRARFYVFTGLASGSAVVYRAANTGGTTMASITYNRDTNQFIAATTAGSQPLSGTVTADRWYSVEINWSRAGGMTATARGAGSTTDLATTSALAVGGTDQIDTAELGWVSGTATVSTTGPAQGQAIVTDAYESRRSTAIGRLCRGDANNDGTRNADDIAPIRDEFFRVALAPGQPDANEDGRVNGDEVGVIRDIFFAGSAQRACATTTL